MEKPAVKEQCCDILYDLLHKRYANQSGIIYTFSIADAEELEKLLKEKGLKVRLP